MAITIKTEGKITLHSDQYINGGLKARRLFIKNAKGETRGRHKGEPTENLSLRIPKSLKKKLMKKYKGTLNQKAVAWLKTLVAVLLLITFVGCKTQAQITTGRVCASEVPAASAPYHIGAYVITGLSINVIGAIVIAQGEYKLRNDKYSYDPYAIEQDTYAKTQKKYKNQIGLGIGIEALGVVADLIFIHKRRLQFQGSSVVFRL